MRHVDAALVVYSGVTGHVAYLPGDDAHASTPPTPTSEWFVPAGWPAWTGSWIEPSEVQSATPDDGGGSAGIHERVPAGVA